MKILLIVLLLLAGVLIAGAVIAGPQLLESLSGLAPQPPGIEVRTEHVTEGKLVETVQAPGRIEPHTHVEIAAEVSARIEELPVVEGQEVRKGDLICKLDDKDLEAGLVSSQARRDGEKFRLRSEEARRRGILSTLEFANRELERIQALFESGDVSRRELDNILERVQELKTSEESANSLISVVESALAAAEADIERAEDGLANTVIVAPMDGMVTWLNVEVGEIVTGSTTNPGTRLMTISDLSRMVHEAEVAESDVASVAIGQRAKLRINAYPDDIFEGTVRQIAWQRTETPNGTGFFETEIEIDLQGRRIRSGLIANADIEIETHEGLIVPYQAIVVREVEELPEALRDDPLVDRTKTKVAVIYRVVDGKAVCTPVRAGPSDDFNRLILEGIDATSEIITGPYKVLETIKHDARVKVESEAAGEGEPDETEGEADAEADTPEPAGAGTAPGTAP